MRNPEAPPLNRGPRAVEGRFRVLLSRAHDLLACSPVAFVGAARRMLGLGDRVLATVEDGERLAVLIAHIGPGATLAELIATLAAGRPSGIAVMSSAEGDYVVAVALRDGVVTGATGTGPLQTLGDWTLEFRRRLTGSIVETASQFDPARTYVTESMLEALARCDGAGASFTLLQGPLTWLDDRVEEGPSLDHLLLEHARRSDEYPRVVAKVGDLDRVIVPLAPPGERAAKPTQKRVLDDEAESGWDFFDDPDPAAVGEWNDARRIFELCDGMTSIDGVVERSMLGRFRTLSAMLALVERSHIAFMAHFAGCDETTDGANEGELGDFLASLDDVG